MLRVSLIGNIGAEPEERYSQKGAKITSFRVAVNQSHSRPDSDERVESTEWFRVRATGYLGDRAVRLHKGFRVLVVGRLDISDYQTRDGRTGKGFDVWADEIQLIRGATGEQQGEEFVAPEQQAEPVGAQAAASSGSPELEDLPF